MVSASKNDNLSFLKKDWKNYIKKYLAFLQFEKKLSSNTINSYWHDLKFFAEYISEFLHLDEFKSINKNHVRDYIGLLNTYNMNDLSLIHI